MTRPLLRGALAGAICATVVSLLSLIDPTLFGSEWLLRDAFTRPIAAERKPDPRIVLVTVSDQSVEERRWRGPGGALRPMDPVRDATMGTFQAGVRRPFSCAEPFRGCGVQQPGGFECAHS